MRLPAAAAASSPSSSSSSASTATSADTASSSSSSSLSSNASTASIDAAASSIFIMKVQHLIERCLTLYLDKEECAKALSKHAGIDPIITRTVWKELEKANQDFFEDYITEREILRQHSYVNEGPEDDDAKNANMR